MAAYFWGTKKVYCAILTERMTGISENDMASAIFKILDKLFEDNPTLTNLILWADSCVPQNRNSNMPYTVSYFMQEHPNINSIVMNFSTGHSCIQEVDNVHNCIDRVLSQAEYYSPILLMRLLLNVYLCKPYCILQMHENDFDDFQKWTKFFHYQNVPFYKVSSLQFTTSYFEIRYKITYEVSAEVNIVNIKSCNNRRSQESALNLPKPKPCNDKSVFTKKQYWCNSFNV